MPGRSTHAADAAFPQPNVPTPVIAHHPTNDDAPDRKPRHRPPETRGTRARELVPQDLDVGDTTVVIDGHMDVVPSHAAAPPLPVAVDPMPDAVNAAQWLDIQVDEIAGRRPFVALDGDRRRRGWLIQPKAAQPGTYRRSRHAQRTSDRPRGQSVLLPEQPNQRDGGRRRLMRRCARPRRRILERGHAAFAEATHPFRDGALTHRKCLRDHGIPPAFTQRSLDHPQPGRGRTLRITIEASSGASSELN
jgi:hypothetical protein